MNYAGYPADWDGLRALASSVGSGRWRTIPWSRSMYGSRMCGSLGDIAAASMMSSRDLRWRGWNDYADREDLYQRALRTGIMSEPCQQILRCLEGERLPELVPFQAYRLVVASIG